MRQTNLEDLPRQEGMHRGPFEFWKACSGYDLQHRFYQRLARILRGCVGRSRFNVLAEIDRRLARTRLPEPLRQNVRESLLRNLTSHGVRARDGRLWLDPQTDRLCCQQGKWWKPRRPETGWTADELRREPEVIGRRRKPEQ
jgi:hypothetical protein